jgi:hypothetical protein
MELEILNNQIISIKINKRSMRNKDTFDFSSSKPFKVYLEVKEEFLSGSTGLSTIRLSGPKEVVQLINSSRLLFADKYNYICPSDIHSTVERLMGHCEILKYGKSALNMTNHELLANNLIEI